MLRMLKTTATRLKRFGIQCMRGLAQVVQALVGGPIRLAILTVLGYTVLLKAIPSPAIKVLLSLGALILVSQCVLAGWDRLPAEDQAQALERWQELTKRLWRSRALGLWPVLLVMLTALVGFTELVPAQRVRPAYDAGIHCHGCHLWILP